MRVTDFFGKQITHQGLKFEGAPRKVFWNGFIDSFIEDLIVRSVEHTARLAADRGIALDRRLLETGALLRGAIGSLYLRMRGIDQRLRRGGYPYRAQPQDVESYRQIMERRLDAVLAGRLARKPFLARLSVHYNAHPFLYWLVGVLLTIAIAALF